MAACAVNFLLIESFLGGDRRAILSIAMSIGPLAICVWKPSLLAGADQRPFQEAIVEVAALSFMSFPLSFAAMLVGMLGAIGAGHLVGANATAIFRDFTWIVALAIVLAHFLPHGARALIRSR